MNRSVYLFASLLFPIAVSAAPSVQDSVLQALDIKNMGLWHMADAVFDNQAINQWRLPMSVSSVNAGYIHSKGDIDPQRGDADNAWQGSAATYTRYRTSTLSGSAQYTNGKRRNVRWCESADIDIVYPYIMADSIGGDIKYESYAFSGAYADHRGRLSWGASLSYKASLEYRARDPRPRNVSGVLDASAAIGYNIFSDYQAAVDIDFRRYTQSNNIEFKSEMGVDKIFHLTGPLQHYVRFGGTGMSTHYRGYRYGGGIALYPSSGHGGFARVHASRFHFDNILSDLNKLPMASATHTALEACIGWLNPGKHFFWAANAKMSTSRRHGRENIFGDATSNIYPQIASIDMFARNTTTASASWLCGFATGASRYQATVTPRYTYTSWLYLNPRAMSRVHAIMPDIRLQWSTLTVPGWLLTASAGVAIYQPWGCQLSHGAVDKELNQLSGIETYRHTLASNAQQHYDITISATKKINRRLALGFNAAYRRGNYTAGTHADNIAASVNLEF